eukprot:TRINITY_DN30396_c0_g1_i1.p1 TRINITY_DN30396_c0_g1~~TRINITY_DN30396_c0_g1_i1.p1  ORF type:complete len:1495 (-),score=244.17 TRINITY_DN30396_c0_g1_i1:110-4594(-)
MWGFIHPNSPGAEQRAWGARPKEQQLLPLPLKMGPTTPSSQQRRPRPPVSESNWMSADKEVVGARLSNATGSGFRGSKLRLSGTFTNAIDDRGPSHLHSEDWRLRPCDEEDAPSVNTGFVHGGGPPLTSGKVTFVVGSQDGSTTPTSSAATWSPMLAKGGCLQSGNVVGSELRMRCSGAAWRGAGRSGGGGGGSIVMPLRPKRGSGARGALQRHSTEPSLKSGPTRGALQRHQTEPYLMSGATRGDRRKGDDMAPLPSEHRERGSAVSVESFGVDKNAKSKPCLGMLCALEHDKRFQAGLMEKWKREQELENEHVVSSTTVQLRQVCKFFDFLQLDPQQDLDPGSMKYIRHVFPYFEAVTDINMNDLTEEFNRSLPEVGRTGDCEHEESLAAKMGGPTSERPQVILTPQTENTVRSVLTLFAEVSKPPMMVSPSSGTERLSSLDPSNVYVSRPTFCRFMVDSRLVALNDGLALDRPTIHTAIRYYDYVMHCEAVHVKDFRVERGATLDQCLEVILHLLNSTKGASDQRDLLTIFEIGLETAEAICLQMQEEFKKRSESLSKVAEALSTNEACRRRISDCYSKHGTPPRNFKGSLWEWTRGIQEWVHSVNESTTPQSAVERFEQQFSQECYLRDSLIDPSCLYVAKRYERLFHPLFNAYCDEERLSVPENKRDCVEWVSHMSFAAFFRFCLDFAIFKELCSFDEIHAAYRTTDGAEHLVKESVTSKLKRATSKMGSVVSMVHLRRRPLAGLGAQMDGLADANATESGIGSAGNASESAAHVELTKLRGAVQVWQGETAHGRSSGHCQTCRVPIASDSVFCHICGTKKLSELAPKTSQPAEIDAEQDRNSRLCRHCYCSVSASSVFCRKCGTKLEEGNSSSTSRHTQLRQRLSRVSVHEGWSERSRLPALLAVEPVLREESRGMDTNSSASLACGMSDEDEHDSDGSSSDESATVMKVSNDFSWINLPFKHMTMDQSDAYSLLSALGDCVSGRFLGVRALFRLMGVTSKKMYIDAKQLSETLKLLNIETSFQSQYNMGSIIGVIDKQNPEGKLDVAELEKATECVREDRRRRGLLSGNDVNPLGVEARRLSSATEELEVESQEHRLASKSQELRAASKSSEAVAVSQPEDPNVAASSEASVEKAEENEQEQVNEPEQAQVHNATSFGVSAFTEGLIMLGFLYMSGNGNATKASAPTGIKVPMLIAFLHHRFDTLVKQQKKFKETLGSKQDIEETNQATQHRKIAEAASKAVLLQREPSKMADSTKEAHRLSLTRSATCANSFGSGHGRSAGALGGGAAGGARALSQSRTVVFAAVTKQEESDVVDTDEQVPDSARYISPLDLLIEQCPTLFDSFASDIGSSTPAKSTERDICTNCSHVRGHSGFDNIFCHICSGVDASPLTENLLYPVLQRQRMRQRMRLRNKSLDVFNDNVRDDEHPKGKQRGSENAILRKRFAISAPCASLADQSAPQLHEGSDPHGDRSLGHRPSRSRSRAIA